MKEKNFRAHFSWSAPGINLGADIVCILALLVLKCFSFWMITKSYSEYWASAKNLKLNAIQKLSICYLSKRILDLWRGRYHPKMRWDNYQKKKTSGLSSCLFYAFKIKLTNNKQPVCDSVSSQKQNDTEKFFNTEISLSRQKLAETLFRPCE